MNFWEEEGSCCFFNDCECIWIVLCILRWTHTYGDSTEKKISFLIIFLFSIGIQASFIDWMLHVLWASRMSNMFMLDLGISAKVTFFIWLTIWPNKVLSAWANVIVIIYFSSRANSVLQIRSMLTGKGLFCTISV